MAGPEVAEPGGVEPLGRPLAGQTIVVTRTATQASRLSHALEALGAQVIGVAVIDIADPSDGGEALRTAGADLRAFDWVVVTSANGAERLLAALGDPSPLLAAVPKVAAIGPGTAEVLENQGITVDLLPERFVAEGLLEVFPTPPSGGGRVLLAQAAGARPILREGLEAARWVVNAVEAYRTVHPPLEAGLLAEAAAADIITFTSGSTAQGYVAAAGLAAVPPFVASIGPITTAAAGSLGVRVTVEAAEHTIPGLVSALVTHLEADR